MIVTKLPQNCILLQQSYSSSILLSEAEEAFSLEKIWPSETYVKHNMKTHFL